MYAILGMVQKPWLIMKMVDYKWHEIWGVYRSCIMVTVASLPIPIIIYRLVDATRLPYFILVGMVCVISVALAVWIVGLDKETRTKVIAFVRRKFKNKYRKKL